MEVQGAPQNADEHDKSLQQRRQSSSSSSDNVILEGTLIYRKVGRLKTKNMRMYCVFDMSGEAGGSLEVGGIGSLKFYQYFGLSKKEESVAYSSTKFSSEEQQESNRELCLDIHGHLPWMVVDVENDPAAFIVEIATSGVDTYGYYDIGNEGNGGEGDKDAGSKIEEELEDGENGNEDDDESGNGNSVFDCWGDSDGEGIDLLEDDEEKDQVRSDLTRAADTDKPYVRYKFKCPSRGNEKASWIAAFKRVGRLCDESKKKKTFGAAVANLATSTSNKNSRIRKMSSVIGDGIRHAEVVGKDVHAGQLPQKEYRVRPSYAYQHRWMTTNELTDEMNASSAVMHDTRLSPAVAPSREISILKCEVMQCLGLPRLKGKKSNTVVYLVCGSYAFTTDVITQCQNPMWLKGMRRACALPIYHGYAELMAGVFHDDGSKGSSSKDTFIGRIEVPIAHLRPNSTYDVILPLRQSTSAYTRKQLGAIRLRFSLECYNERQAILSYLPSRRPAYTTVACSDHKSFRNIALTVHGVHLKEKFAADIFKAHIRELTFIHAVMHQAGKQFLCDLTSWKQPMFSAYCFGGWMHCSYSNSIALLPVYFLGLVLLHLIVNYIRCSGSGGDFRPATWKELLLALHNDSTKRTYIASAKSSKAGTTVLHDSLEFPFASYAGYTRYSVDESLNTSKKNFVEEDDEIGDAIDDLEPDNTIPTGCEKKLKFPEQNIDVKTKKEKKDKNISDELKEVECRFQKSTKHLFDYHTYYSTDDPNPPFGLKTSNDKGYELDKLLGVGQYSQWNPIVSKFTAQFIPIIRILSVVLSIYRSTYSIATWRDPILTFWMSGAVIVLALVLSIFPWRMVLFISGLLFLGPQNWVFRIVKERFLSGERKSKTGRIMRALKELFKDNDGNDVWSKDINKEATVESVQPIVRCHAPASNPLVEQTCSDQAQYILVPYSPIFFNRFSDWPPDPKHSRAFKGELEFSGSVSPSSSNDVVTAPQLLRPLSLSCNRQGKAEEGLSLCPENEDETKAETLRSMTPPPPIEISSNPLACKDTSNSQSDAPPVEGKKKNRFKSRISAKLQPAIDTSRMVAKLRQPALDKYKQHIGKSKVDSSNNNSDVDVTNDHISEGTLGEGIPSVIETKCSTKDDPDGLEASDASVLTGDGKHQGGGNTISLPNDAAHSSPKEQTIYEEENSAQSGPNFDSEVEEEENMSSSKVPAEVDTEGKYTDEGDMENSAEPEVVTTPGTPSSDNENDKATSRQSPDSLQLQLEQLLSIKLELATARAQNDEYRMKLKDTEAERDMYREKYEHAHTQNSMNMASLKKKFSRRTEH